MANTATWDESNPEDVICVVGANGKSQAIHGRSVEETQGRIPKVMVSEFRFSQPEADEFAKMAAERRTQAAKAADDQAAVLRRTQGVVQALTQRSQKLEDLLAAAEKDRDGAISARDSARNELAAAKITLQQAENKILALEKAADPPPAPKTDDKKAAESSDDGKADKAS